MELLDLLIMGGLALGAVRGTATGLVRQVAGVLSMILAFTIAVYLMNPAGQMLAQSLNISMSIAPVAGFVVVFVVIQLAVYAVTRGIEKMVGALKLSMVDRALGGVFGAAKAALALSVLFLVLGRFGVPASVSQSNSALYGPIASAVPATWSFFSDRLPEIQAFAEQFTPVSEEEAGPSTSSSSDSSN
ncbi:MAG: CvpA family protein [Bacteroidota bacterium]